LQLVLDGKEETSVRENAGVSLVGTPLFQSNFLPDLTQVNVLFPTIDLIPTFVHLAPALAEAFAGISGRSDKRVNTDTAAINLFFIDKG
jgi:hypothetical protein